MGLRACVGFRYVRNKCGILGWALAWAVWGMAAAAEYVAHMWVDRTRFQHAWKGLSREAEDGPDGPSFAHGRKVARGEGPGMTDWAVPGMTPVPCPTRTTRRPRTIRP